jgi:tetratricopeptide (TPR) repeat protein
MGRVQQQIDFDWAAANASFAKAVELEPNNPEPLRLAAYSADFLGDFDKAITLSRRAIDADPLNAESWEALGETELYMGQLDQAAVDLKHAIQSNPDFWNSHIFLSEVYILQGRPQDALPEIEQVRFAPFRAWLYSIASYALGRRKESDAALTELVTKYHATSPCLIADVYAYRKQSDEAFRWLDQAYTSHNDGLVTMKHDRFLRSLHDDPRYTALLKKLNLPN